MGKSLNSRAGSAPEPQRVVSGTNRKKNTHTSAGQKNWPALPTLANATLYPRWSTGKVHWKLLCKACLSRTKARTHLQLSSPQEATKIRSVNSVVLLCQWIDIIYSYCLHQLCTVVTLHCDRQGLKWHLCKQNREILTHQGETRTEKT